MSEDFEKAVVLKRSTKKKSGYVVEEREGEYFITGIPAKARANEGDRVVGINGISSDEFLDEDDANGLIESIRIVVVPQDKIKEYEAAKEAEEAGDGEEEEEESSGEEYEEVQRPRSTKKKEEKKKGKPQAAAAAPPPKKEEPTILHCGECGHDNEDLEPDEDGDLVCEECGNVIDPNTETALVAKPDEASNGDEVLTCPDCGHENVNPEEDEDGDKVCEECGTILQTIVECPDCGHKNVNPEPDDDGDYVCEECGTVLEKQNQSKADRLLAMHNEKAEKIADGQMFGDDGKPVTNQQGKQLTPADMFSPGDVITVTVGKSNPKQDPGLKIEEVNGKYYVRKVPSGGLFAKTPVIAGDKILELNGRDSKDYRDVNEMKKTIKDEKRITIVVLRRDPDASESSASSVDLDNVDAVVASGGSRGAEEDDDYDTVGYDGHDCGTIWCPQCKKGPILALEDGSADDSD